MPHRNLGIVRTPTNFTIDRILSKNDQSSTSNLITQTSLSSSAPILHHHHIPMNKVLESNPWIPKCTPLILPPLSPSFTRKFQFPPITSPIDYSRKINQINFTSSSNFTNFHPNFYAHYGANPTLSSSFNYLLLSSHRTASTTSTSTSPSGTEARSFMKVESNQSGRNRNNNHSKNRVYDSSLSDKLNQFNNSLSLNTSVVSNNNVSEESVNRSVISAISTATPPEISSESRFRCAICLESFHSCELLKIHDKSHAVKPKYECNVCEKKFSQLRNYKYHMSVHLGTKEFAADCSECGKTFNDRGYLSSHMKIHRNKKEYNCSYCPKSFNQRVAFNMHVRIHLGLKPHTCQECGKQFSRKMLLKQHHRTHSGEKPYKCTFSGCEKRFADRSNMILHHRLHSGIKPFACTICPKRFSKKHHLGTHMNYHTGNKPYECLHGCGQRFTQSSNMRTHAKKCQFRLHASDDISSSAAE